MSLCVTIISMINLYDNLKSINKRVNYPLALSYATFQSTLLSLIKSIAMYHSILSFIKSLISASATVLYSARSSFRNSLYNL